MKRLFPFIFFYSKRLRIFSTWIFPDNRQSCCFIIIQCNLYLYEWTWYAGKCFHHCKFYCYHSYRCICVSYVLLLSFLFVTRSAFWFCSGFIYSIKSLFDTLLVLPLYVISCFSYNFDFWEFQFWRKGLILLWVKSDEFQIHMINMVTVLNGVRYIFCR